METELGYRFIVVDTSCRFVVYDLQTPSVGTAIEGTLTPEQATELSDFLVLEEWYELGPAYGPCGIADGGTTTIKWSDRTVTLGGGASAADCEEPPADFRHELDKVLSQVASQLEALGTPASGDIRYLLWPWDTTRATYPDDPAYINPAEWPLDIAPENLATPGPSDPVYWQDALPRVAKGDDAQALRDLRTAFLEGDVGPAHASSIPIEQLDGSRYQLELRDVIEFELDGRPVVPWRTKGDLRLTAIASPSVTGVSFKVFCGGAGDPVAQGDLELFYESGDERYWSGGATDLPQGPCEVSQVATTAEGELPCSPYGSDDDSLTISIRAGWTTFVSFNCGR